MNTFTGTTKTIFLLSTLFFLSSFSAAAQSAVKGDDRTGQKGDSGPYTFDLSMCALDCFARGFTSFYEPKTYLLPLRQGQRVRISIRWAEPPASVVDPSGTIDRRRNGFVVIDPQGRLIRNSRNEFDLTAGISGAYRIIVRPTYRGRTKRPAKGERVDYDYRLDVTTYPQRP